MRTIRDVMHGEMEVLRTTETAADAASFLATHREDAVPLCLNDGSLAGMVSNRDIVAQVVAKGRDPRQVSLAEFAGPPTWWRSTSTSPWRTPWRSCAAHERARLPVSRGSAWSDP